MCYCIIFESRKYIVILTTYYVHIPNLPTYVYQYNVEHRNQIITSQQIFRRLKNYRHVPSFETIVKHFLLTICLQRIERKKRREISMVLSPFFVCCGYYLIVMRPFYITTPVDTSLRDVQTLWLWDLSALCWTQF